MTKQEINEYFTYIYNKTNHTKQNKNILSTYVGMFPLYLNEEPYKKETIKILVENKNPQYLLKLWKNGYITINDIKIIQQDTPEVFYTIPKEIYIKYPCIKDLILNNNKVVYDLLPDFIKEDEMIKEKCKNNKIEKNNNRDCCIYDENGNLKIYFELDNYKIEKEEDYLKILEVFLTSKMCIEEFCDVYGINNIEGFRSLLNCFRTNNNEKLLKIKENAEEKNLESIKQITEKIDNNEITFEEYLKYYYKPSHTFEHIFKNIVDKEKLLIQLVEYINNNIDTINLDALLVLFDITVSGLQKRIRSYTNQIKTDNKDYYKKVKNFSLTKYTTPYKRPYLLCTYIKDDKRYEVDDEIIDQAVVYVEQNNIYKCHYTMTELTKKIAFGEINIKKETNNNKVYKKII